MLTRFGISASKLNQLIELGIVTPIDPDTRKFFDAAKIEQAKVEFPFYFLSKKITDTSFTDCPLAELLGISRSQISYLVYSMQLQPIDFRRGHFVFSAAECNRIYWHKINCPIDFPNHFIGFREGKAYPRLKAWRQYQEKTIQRKRQQAELFNDTAFHASPVPFKPINPPPKARIDGRKTDEIENLRNSRIPESSFVQCNICKKTIQIWGKIPAGIDPILCDDCSGRFKRPSVKAVKESGKIIIELGNATLNEYRFDTGSDTLVLDLNGAIRITISGVVEAAKRSKP